MSKADLTWTAGDAEDLGVLSARLQDAVARVGDLVYLPRRRRFAALFNRFKWEAGGNERVRAGLYFDGVLKARARNMRRGAPGAVVSLLAIRFAPKVNSPEIEDPAGTVELVFSGDGSIMLEVECLDAGLRDLGGAWAARGRPRHDGPAAKNGGR